MSDRWRSLLSQQTASLEAQKVREALIEKRPDTKEPIDNLLLFMEPYSYKPTNKIYHLRC